MKKQNNGKGQNKKRNSTILLVLLGIVTIIAVGICAYLMNQNKEEHKNIAYTQLLQDIENGMIEKIEMTVGSTTLKVTYTERENDDDKEKVIIPNTQAFIEYLHQKSSEGIKVNLEQKESGILAGIKSNLLSLISTGLMIAIVIMIFKMQGLRR